jgi:dimethylaniline monooxygenase (N-oxide forming)
MSAQKRVCVIGAGASGLVAAKTLRESGFDVVMFEKASSIGGVFAHGAYEPAELVSSRNLTAFSDFRIGNGDDDYKCSDGALPMFLPLPEYVRYLQAYADKHSLLSVAHFSTTVSRVVKQKTGKYVMETKVESQTQKWNFDYVCVAAGLHQTPWTPSVDGLASFTGKVLHSQAYKSPQQLTPRGRGRWCECSW